MICGMMEWYGSLRALHNFFIYFLIYIIENMREKKRFEYFHFIMIFHISLVFHFPGFDLIKTKQNKKKIETYKSNIKSI